MSKITSFTVHLDQAVSSEYAETLSQALSCMRDVSYVDMNEENALDDGLGYRRNCIKLSELLYQLSQAVIRQTPQEKDLIEALSAFVKNKS